jgi:hypothetical protein
VFDGEGRVHVVAAIAAFYVHIKHDTMSGAGPKTDTPHLAGPQGAGVEQPLQDSGVGGGIAVAVIGEGPLIGGLLDVVPRDGDGERGDTEPRPGLAER